MSPLLLAWILLPFYGAILWAIIIAVLFMPIYRRLLPFALMTASLAREASLVYQRIHSGDWNPAVYLRGLFDALPSWVSALLERAGVADFDTLQRQVTSALVQGSRFIATHAFDIGLDTFGFVVSLGVTLYLAFFLIRDGDELAQIAKTALPVPPQCKQELMDKFMAVVRATVKGNLLVAGIQGLLGGLAFWFLDVKGALLWAVLMAVLSLLPMFGAGIVWLPVTAYFFITGSLWQGLALLAYGLFVIGLADNLLRPMLVGKNVGMPDYVVMITTLGGMVVFGVNGFILGPMIAAMFIAVWHVWVTATPQEP